MGGAPPAHRASPKGVTLPTRPFPSDLRESGLPERPPPAAELPAPDRIETTPPYARPARCRVPRRISRREGLIT